MVWRVGSWRNISVKFLAKLRTPGNRERGRGGGGEGNQKIANNNEIISFARTSKENKICGKKKNRETAVHMCQELYTLICGLIHAHNAHCSSLCKTTCLPWVSIRLHHSYVTWLFYFYTFNTIQFESMFEFLRPREHVPVLTKRCKIT